MMAGWRGGNLATMRSTTCKRERVSNCSRGSTSGGGGGGGGLSRGRDLAEEPELADFFLDSAMHLKVGPFEINATGRRKKDSGVGGRISTLPPGATPSLDPFGVPPRPPSVAELLRRTG